MPNVTTFLEYAQNLWGMKHTVLATYWCKRVLKIEKHNCKALVLLGEIHGESGEALNWFHKAIHFHPRDSFAWLGLAKYYEKKDDTISKFQLLRVYKEILNCELQSDKAEEVICKVAELGVSLKDIYSAGILIDFLTRLPPPPLRLHLVADKQLIKMSIRTVTSNSMRVFLIQHRILRKISSGLSIASMSIILGKIVLMNNGFSQAFHFNIKLSRLIPNVIFRIWFCEYICSYYAQMETFRDVDVEKYYNDIVQGFRDLMWAKLLNSMILYNKKKYLDAYLICFPLVDFEQPELPESLFLIKCTLKARYWPVSVIAIKKIMSNLRDCKYKLELNKFLFLALAQQKKWSEAITAARKIPLEMLLVEEQAVLATCYIENRENPERLMNILQPTAYYVQLKALTLIVKKNFFGAINLLQREQAENPVHYLYMARAYWNLKAYRISYIYLLKASKLDGENAEPNFYLGKYYHNKSNLGKAQEYYERAHRLDPTNPIILKSLSDVYLAQGLVEENYNL